MKFTRRGFLRSTFGVPFVTGFGSLGGVQIFTSAAALSSYAATLAPVTEPFPHPEIIHYDAHCFTIHGTDTFIFGAAMHYPRCPRELWRDRLQKLQRASFNTIETYVFWNYHEPEEGRSNLTEFEDFVKLVQEMGFWMIVRPGPYVCAEWDAGGFPHWVIAKRFPLRSNHPESIRTSQHWYDQVLPVIERNQITRGGPIILMQIENEYDSWNLGDSEKREYIRALAQMAWKAGIEVPLITCWTKQVRDRTDPDMARIAEFCNFYPGWNVVNGVVPGLEKLRKEETASPVGVVELQGGWFSENGQKLSVDQDGISAAQLSLLSKTVIEQGATFFSYYMGFGGTNFDWAAKRLTTTYDYAAPLREPGGLWDKYHAARGIGDSLRLFGNMLTRADFAENGAKSSNPAVSVTLRVKGSYGMLFLRNNENSEQRCTLTIRDPYRLDPDKLPLMISFPKEGELVLGPREMRMLPASFLIAGCLLRYTTAEVLDGAPPVPPTIPQQPRLILYDKPGRTVEFSIRATRHCKIEGDTLYQHFDDPAAPVFGVRVAEAEKTLKITQYTGDTPSSTRIIVLPRESALHTWRSPAGRSTQLLITDAATLADVDRASGRNEAALEFPPGEHTLTTMVPQRPSKLLLNGSAAAFAYDDLGETIRARVTVPALPLRPIAISEVETWIERCDTASGSRTINLAPLEELGEVPYGYVQYRSEFDYNGESTLALSLFTADAAKVFVNGKRLRGTTDKSGREMSFPLTGHAKPGKNTIDISYEAFGSANFGPEMAELKGIQSAKLQSDGRDRADIGPWHVHGVPAVLRGGRLDLEMLGAERIKRTLQGSGSTAEAVPTFTWCNASFTLEKPPDNWFVPLKAIFRADSDALLYLNGRFVGRYVTIGPQTEFYLPEPWLIFDPERRNSLAIILANTDSPQPIRALTISPYEEFAACRVRVGLE
jgi:hypothetical protein